MNNLPPIVRILALLLGIILFFYVIRTQIVGCERIPNDRLREVLIPPKPNKDTLVISSPEKPHGKNIKGVVEMGAKGFNFFIVNIDEANNWKLIKAKFGSSLVYERLASKADIIAALKDYISEMLNYGVDGKNIHFIVGSGARTNDRTLKIEEALKKLRYVINTVTPEQEAQYAFKSAMPRQYLQKGFVVDIGSGNSKIAWLDEKGKIQGLETYGAKYFQDGVTDEAVIFQVKNQVSQVPEQRRSVCFIIGGVPFEMAKPYRQNEERYTILKKPDDYETGGDLRFASGLNIYTTIRKETDCKFFVFDWDANFSIGFLLDL